MTLTMTKLVYTEIRDGIAWVTIDNPPVNSTSTGVRAGLIEALQSVQGCDLAVLRCAGKTFVAGGDMSEFDAPPVAPHLPDIVDALENSATPFLAILHGSVLGGGLEIAMACAFRVAKPGTRFGLPEVNVGLIPGAGGTQRAPRLLGWDMAVDMAVFGSTKTTNDLLAVGAIDLVSATPEDEVRQFLGRAYTPVSQRVVDQHPDFLSVEERARKVAKGTKAPLHNLMALSWATEPYCDAQPKERALHLKLRASEESKALRHIFFAERAAAKPAQLAGASEKDIAQVAIVGGGLMGCGIAAASLTAGYAVTLIERDDAAADQAQSTVASLLDGARARGKLTADKHRQCLDQLSTTTRYETVAGADLAIEAVFENLDVKRDVFARLAKLVRPDALLATNTSYLDPNDIFSGVPKPARCLGLHFFSPAHIMKLVEVIEGAGTSSQTLATAFRFAKTLRKTPVLTGICDGFVGNRILTAYRRAAEYLLADGALPHEVDAAMRAFGMAMGPFEAQDQAGLQIAEAYRRRHDATRDPAERYVPIADRLCAENRYGQKTGAGWYRYAEGSRTPQRDDAVDGMILTYSDETGLTRKTFATEDIQTQLLAAMANEGARIVDEGIAASADVVDVVKTAGYGFPRWRGGPMHWADTIGDDIVRKTLDDMDIASPGSWVRARRYQ